MTRLAARTESGPEQTGVSDVSSSASSSSERDQGVRRRSGPKDDRRDRPAGIPLQIELAESDSAARAAELADAVSVLVNIAGIVAAASVYSTASSPVPPRSWPTTWLAARASLNQPVGARHAPFLPEAVRVRTKRAFGRRLYVDRHTMVRGRRWDCR
jgi:hypothetical protein